MSDFNFGGTDEESAEIKKINAEVVRLFTPSHVALSLIALRAARRSR